MNDKVIPAPWVDSIGTAPGGNPVVRVTFADGRKVDVETNMRSYVKMAAAGVTIINRS